MFRARHLLVRLPLLLVIAVVSFSLRVLPDGHEGRQKGELSLIPIAHADIPYVCELCAECSEGCGGEGEGEGY